MLVPVAGRYDAAEVNRRRVPPVPKSLREQDPRKFPPVYVFNVGPRRHEFPPLNQGLRILEACPKGQLYSKPLVFRNIEMEPYDLADGAGNMAWLEEDGIDKAKALIHEGRGGLSIDADLLNDSSAAPLNSRQWLNSIRLRLSRLSSFVTQISTLCGSNRSRSRMCIRE